VTAGTHIVTYTRIRMQRVGVGGGERFAPSYFLGVDSYCS